MKRMNIIVVTTKPLTSLSSGYDLRVWHLCRVLAKAGHRLGLVEFPLMAREAAEFNDSTIDISELFDDRHRLDAAHVSQASLLRYLRVGEKNYIKRAYPALFREAREVVKKMRDRLGADRILVFGPQLSCIISERDEVRVLVDVCDSVVLTTERQLQMQASRGQRASMKSLLGLARWKYTEARLPNDVALVTTISAADSASLRQLSGGAANIVTIPNGVAPELELWQPQEPKRARSVVFWGNLAFGPNADAIRYFHDEIFVPYLAEQDVELCIVGRDAPQWLRDHADSSPRINLMGFVRELYPLVSEFPVMVNPMVSGGGMKNKVLEAFAVGCAVVSTTLGIDAVEGAEPDRHFAIADSPKAFAEQVLNLLDHDEECRNLAQRAREFVIDRYTWTGIGERWLEVVQSLQK